MPETSPLESSAPSRREEVSSGMGASQNQATQSNVSTAAIAAAAGMYFFHLGVTGFFVCMLLTPFPFPCERPRQPANFPQTAAAGFPRRYTVPSPKGHENKASFRSSLESISEGNSRAVLLTCASLAGTRLLSSPMAGFRPVCGLRAYSGGTVRDFHTIPYSPHAPLPHLKQAR